MAKKKNISKKHKFKHVEAGSAQPLATVAPTDPATVSPAAKTAAPARATAPAPAYIGSGRDFRYVSTDLKRIGILAASLVALELVLYYVLQHTVLGTTVYSLVRI